MEENKPLISVIIPVYNTEKYLHECVLSVVQQDYENLEIIIVDDGSTDNSLHIAQSIKQNYKGILRVFHTANSGVSHARNFGIKHSHGDYLFFVDADDYLDKDCISYYYQLAHNHQADTAIVPQPNKFHEDTSRNTKNKFNPMTKVISGEEAVKEMLYYKIIISSWGKLFNKKIIDTFHIHFDEKLAYGEGFLFAIQYFHKAKKVAIGCKPVYNYRLSNSNSVMTNYRKRLVQDSIASQKAIQDELDKNHEFNSALTYAYWHTCVDCLNTIVGAKAIKSNLQTFKSLRKTTRHNSLKNLKEPIPKKDKIKSVLYYIVPTTTARLINRFRKRKFTKGQ